MKSLKLYNHDLVKNIFYYFIMKSKRSLNKTRKHQNSTNKRKIYGRKTRKQGGVIFGSTRVLPQDDAVDNIKNKIENLIKDLNDCASLESCSKPDSKSKQLIHICSDSVYKGPPSQFQPQIAVSGEVIKVDPHTMNLLVQGCIRQLQQKDTIEKYDEICKTTIDSNISYALKGPKYSYNLESFGIEGYAFSIEDFIEKTAEHIENMEASEQQTEELKQQIAAKIVEWIISFTKDLDYLFTEMQFHHCDPKAAQLFLKNDGKVILGDLDKVTFTMKVGDKPYRIRLVGEKKIQHLVGEKNLQRFVDFADKAGSLINIKQKSSIPTIMRYEDKPYSDNKYEKGVFIASILLLLHKDIAEGVIENIKLYKNEDIKSLLDTIELIRIGEKLLINTFYDSVNHIRKTLDNVPIENFFKEAEKELKKKNPNRKLSPDEIFKKAKSLKFKSKTSHVLASKCVEFNKKRILDSNVKLEDITNKPPA